MPYGNGLSGLEAAAYLHAAGFSSAALVTAIAIGKSESGLVMKRSDKANANGTYDWGFMQINDVHNPSAQVKTDPAANARAAYKVYADAGHSFTPWTTYNNGAYKANLTFAKQSVMALQNAPDFERQLLAGQHPGSAGNPITLNDPTNPSIGGIGLPNTNNLPNPIQAGLSAVVSQLNKIAGNGIAVAVAIALIVLGVMLIRGKDVVKVAGTVAKVV